MTTSPIPNAYDVAGSAILALAELQTGGAFSIGEIVSKTIEAIMTGAFNLILTPILNAITEVVEFLIASFGTIFNGAFQIIINTAYLFIINPIKAMTQTVLNRFYDRLEGVVFIAMTVPLMVSEMKGLMEKPSLKGLMLLCFKPIVGAFSAKVFSAILKPMLSPVSIPPSIPPEIILIPPPATVSLHLYDTLDITDTPGFEYYGPLDLLTIPDISDEIALYTYDGLGFIDIMDNSDILTFDIEDNLYENWMEIMDISDILTINVV